MTTQEVGKVFRGSDLEAPDRASKYGGWRLEKYSFVFGTCLLCNYGSWTDECGE